MHVRLRIIHCFLALFLALMTFEVTVAQEESVRLELLGIDTSEFPLVRVTLRTANNQSAAISDLSDLTLRENGAPVTDITFAGIPTGIDVTFVLDANVGFNEVDEDGGLSRREKVQASIRRFAEQTMDREGRDRVSIIVPADDGQAGQFLVQDAATPAELIEAIESYDPAALRPTPLNAMLTQALEQMQQRRENDRYRAVLLFSDGRRLPEQLSYPLLTAPANDNNTPIYVAILGAIADEQEIANVERLFAPTRATYVHMPEPIATDAIYEIWRDQGQQTLLTYRSQQRQNGRSQININLGPAFASAEFDVAFSAPEVLLKEDAIQIDRVGMRPEAAITELQPAVQPLAARVFWPDGQPRALDNVQLTLNGEPQPIEGDLPVQAADNFELQWDVSALDAGEYELLLTVTDELGYEGSSAVVPVTISVDRPAVPTAAPTALAGEPAADGGAAAALLPAPLEPLAGINGDLGAVIAGTLLILAVAVLWRRRSREEETAQASPIESPPAAEEDSSVAEAQERVARLVPTGDPTLEPIEFFGENITIGRTAGLADIIIARPSLAHLHARIRYQDGDYWLFDEGSTEGTHLNYERLGLAPRTLEDGDVVQFGTESYRFKRGPVEATQSPDDSPPAESRLAVVFDMDGLMVDTEPLSRRAWDDTLADLGFDPLDDGFYRTLIGHRLRDAAQLIVTQHGLAIEPSELAWRKEAKFAAIREQGIPVMPGLYELLSMLDQRDIPWGVATSTPRHIAEEILETIGVLESCAGLAAGDEVARSKPHPDVYLLAAERLGSIASSCLALEDSAPGCQSANAAGMVVVAVPESYSQGQDFPCADYVMTSLLDVIGRLDDLLSELRLE